MECQEARKWATGHSKNETLDYSEKSDGVRGISDADSGAESISMQQKSLVDMDEDYSGDSEEVSTVTSYLSAQNLPFVHHSSQELGQLWALVRLSANAASEM